MELPTCNSVTGGSTSGLPPWMTVPTRTAMLKPTAASVPSQTAMSQARLFRNDPNQNENGGDNQFPDLKELNEMIKDVHKRPITKCINNSVVPKDIEKLAREIERIGSVRIKRNKKTTAPDTPPVPTDPTDIDLQPRTSICKVVRRKLRLQRHRSATVDRSQ